MVLVKICGITNLDDALAAADAGADALGFNFYARSPRYLTPESARTIVDRLRVDYPNILNVGVFVNEGLDAIQKIAAVAGVSALQLHGDETPEAQLQTDREQQQDDAQLGEGIDRVRVGDGQVVEAGYLVRKAAEPSRADDHTNNDEPYDRRNPQARKCRDDDSGSGKNDERVAKA